MATFDFISSDEFRASLERDADELVRCMKAGAWKSAHVMAASLIQATLADYLISSGTRAEDELTRLNITQMLELCRSEQALTPRTLELATFLRSYSDFLSPSKRTRLEAAADETGARIAQALLEIVINEVSGRKRETLQYSAEQVLAKVQSDPSAVAIMSHLLRRISRAELERLLTHVIPKTYFEVAASEDAQKDEIIERFELCFRAALEFAPPELKRAVAVGFLRILENESEYVVQSYENSFFRAADLQFLEEEERGIIKAHFFASLSKQVTLPLLNAAAGMAEFLTTEEESRAFFVPLVLSLESQTERSLAEITERRVTDEYARLSGPLRKSIRAWMGRVRRAYEREARQAAAAALGRLQAALAG